MIKIGSKEDIDNLRKTHFTRNQQRTERVEFICEKCGKKGELILRTFLESKNDLICKSCSSIRPNNTWVTNNVWTNEIRQRRKETCLKKYGVEYNLQRRVWDDKSHTKEICNKRKETSNSKFGKDNYMNRKKFKETCISRFGGPGPFYDKDIKKRSCIGYIYDNTHFDSSWELAYYIWLKDLNKKFIYHPDIKVPYIDDLGIERLYEPDFIVEGTFIEIKGNQFFDKNGNPYNYYKKESWNNKYDLMIKNKVKILTEVDLKESLEYVHKKYGKTFLKDQKKSAQKRADC
jgi:hypothetical protein